MIDDAEDVSLAWVASADAGATASIVKAPGYRSDTAIALRYNIPSASSRYVYATKTLAAPVTAIGLTMRVKSRPDVIIQMRVTPQTGPAVIHWFSRPLESALDADGWYLNAIRFAAPVAIASITLIVGDAYDHPALGDLVVDDLRAVDSFDSSWALATRSPRLLPALPGSELFGDRLGISWHAHHGTGILDKMKEAGCSFIRADMNWEWIEIPDTGLGKYDFSWYDGVFSQLQARGMGALFILGYGHKNYNLRTAAGIAAMGKFAEAAAQHYAGLDVRFEVYNEPDLNWPGTIAEYAALLSGVIAGAKRGDAKVRICNGGLVWFEFSRIKQYLTAGVGAGVTAWAMHGYRNDRPETLVDSVLAFRWLQRRINGRSLPLWITEWGYSLGRLPATQAKTTAFERQQAAAVVRQVLSQWMLNLSVAVLYDAVDDGADPNNGEHNYGLLDRLGAPKPSWHALKRLADFVAARELIGLIADAPYGLHVAKLGGAADTGYILWVSEPGLTVTIQAPSAGATDYVGPAIATRGGVMTISLRADDGPAYLTYSGVR